MLDDYRLRERDRRRAACKLLRQETQRMLDVLSAFESAMKEEIGWPHVGDGKARAALNRCLIDMSMVALKVRRTIYGWK